MTHVLWTVIFVADYLNEYETVWKVLVGLVVVFLLLIDILYVIPRLVRQYTIINYVSWFLYLNCVNLIFAFYRSK